MAMAGGAALGRAIRSGPRSLFLQGLDLPAGADSSAGAFRRIVFQLGGVLLAWRDTAGVLAPCAMLREQYLPYSRRSARRSGFKPQRAMARPAAFFPG